MAKVKDTETTSISESVPKIEPVAGSEAYLKERVPVKLIKDKQHKDDVIVRVNGYAFQIQRGVTVMVPRYIKEVLDNKELQEQEALDRSLELQIDPNDNAFR